MEACKLNYVPERLHSLDRDPIPEFYIGEHLFRRCTAEQLEAPFEKASLYDLSLNRQGDPAAPISGSDDALWNCEGKEGVGERFEMEVAHYKIMELDVAGQYRKPVMVEGTGSDGNPESIGCTISLEHDKTPCNFAHTVLAFTVADKLVTKENYPVTLGKKGKKWSDLRNRCKQEIEKMRFTGEIWITWPGQG